MNDIKILSPIGLKDISTSVNNAEIPIGERKRMFMEHFAEFMRIDMAAGQASEDTVRTYMNQLKIYFIWYEENYPGMHPLDASPTQLSIYRLYLYETAKCKQTTVSLKLSVLRRFYAAAVKNALIKRNPCQDLYAGANRQAPELGAVRSLTLNQLNIALHEMHKLEMTEEHLRNMALFCIMVLQGWRTVEVFRSSIEDIDFERSLILVHGKRRDRYCNPRVDVMELLVKYFNFRTVVIKDERGTPLFTSLSNQNYGQRISRYGIRMIIDKWLEQLEYKIPGFSCHGLRHTFATQLYAVTKDLNLVAEELGHANVNQASKYAHIIDRHLRRIASAIPVKVELPANLGPDEQ